jgi:hypothetical protein
MHLSKRRPAAQPTNHPTIHAAGSLFTRYKFEPPTEQFSLKTFTAAFAAVQSSVVHLRGPGVSPAKRFALVPAGPPTLAYSSTAKAAFAYDAATREVRLAVDRPVAAGAPLVAWCGPQPNGRLLINYGLVDDDNPYDTLAVTAVIPQSDPLLPEKRTLLGGAGLSTSQAFNMSAAAPLPPQLLPFLRVAFAATAAELASVRLDVDDGAAAGGAAEARALRRLAAHLRARLAGYGSRAPEEDDAVVANPASGPREVVAARLVRIEKRILGAALAAVLARPGAEAAAAGAEDAPGADGVRLL